MVQSVWGTKILQASWYRQKNPNQKQQKNKPQKTMASFLTEVRFSLTFYIKSLAQYYKGFPGGSDSKKSTCNAGDLGFNPWVRKIPWRREWLLTPVLAWRIPRTEEPGGLQSVGLGARCLFFCPATSCLSHYRSSFLSSLLPSRSHASPAPGHLRSATPTDLLKCEPDNMTAQAHTL